MNHMFGLGSHSLASSLSMYKYFKTKKEKKSPKWKHFWPKHFRKKKKKATEQVWLWCLLKKQTNKQTKQKPYNSLTFPKPT